jgi:hypothetical protein
MMSEKNYPTKLRPIESMKLSLSDRAFDVPKVSLTFTAAPSHDLGDRFGGKPVIRYDGTAMFAEVAIQRMLTHANWQARWIETYGRPNMDPLVMKKWTKGAARDQANEPIDSAFVSNLLLEIATRNGSSYSGCWDIVGWSGERVVFFESKRKARDRIRSTQVRWLLAGLEAGLSTEDFVVVEWSFA